METKWTRIALFTFLLLIVSCDDPITIVTNYIHRDGSITRVIEMRSSENNFKVSDVQVPYDSSWSVRDSIEISKDNDTTWVRTVEKTFADADALNEEYLQDSSSNGELSRSVAMIKRFHWFNTEIRFSERIAGIMEFGYPVEDFLDKEELSYFYSPDFLSQSLADGPDSLKMRALIKSMNDKGEVWMIKSALSEWIGQFGKLIKGPESEKIINDLRDREAQIYILISEKYSDGFDSLWKAGIIQADIIGRENAEKFKNEADSAMSIAMESLFSEVNEYSVRIVMPGKLTGTNGFADSTKSLLWGVSSEYFLTRPYEMWAESKVPNIWAWAVSGIFVLFVLTGIILRTKKRGL